MKVSKTLCDICNNEVIVGGIYIRSDVFPKREMQESFYKVSIRDCDNDDVDLCQECLKKILMKTLNIKGSEDADSK